MPRSARGRPPRLDRDRIVQTALAMIDRDGVDALTMRRVGAELGVDPMAVYYYIADKAALLDAVVEAVFEEIGELDVEPGSTWQSVASEAGRRMRTVLRRHPHAIGLVGTRPALTPRRLAAADRAIERLVGTGLDASTALNVLACLRAFILGYVLVEVGVPVGAPSGPNVASPDVMAQYPSLAAAMAQGYDPDRQFELGLQALVDGLSASLQ